MRKLPRIIKVISNWLLVIGFLLFAAASINSIQAQESPEIPGPELEDASFVPVGDLKIGDWVFVKGEEGLTPEQITKLEYHQEEVEVYNLSVDGEETFFANDFAVHNKAPGRSAVCFIEVSPRVSTAATEPWSIATHGQAFKNLFQFSGIGRGGDGFVKGGAKICRFGQVINGCQYPARGLAEWCGDNPCRGCGKAYGDTCVPSSNGCARCEMTCGPWLCKGGGHEAGSDRIRFRQHGNICDGVGCGAALKVTAPNGYVIKSISFQATSQMCGNYGSKPYCEGHIYFSRGMRWHLEDSMVPNVTFFTLPSRFNGKKTVQMQRATKYFFIYSFIRSKDKVGVDLLDNWAELWNIELELIKTEVQGTEVEVVNNSLFWYDAGHKVGTWHFRALTGGTIWFSNDNGATWSEPHEVPEDGLFSYPWEIDPNNPFVLAKVLGQDAPYSYCGAGITYTPLTGTIRGTVYDVMEAGTSCPFDISGGGVGGGEVKLVGATEQGPISIGGDGTFSFPDIPAGQYTLLMTDVPEGYVSPAFCDQDGVSDDATVVLVGNDEEVVNIGLTKIGDAWFQTTDGDVHAQTSIADSIPPGATEGPYCSLLGDGGFPGVISHGTSADFGDDGSASEKGWLANSIANVTYSFDYFYQLLDSPAENWDGSVGNFPADPGTGETEIVYTAAADANLPGFSNLSGRKIIVLASEDANINSDITITDGFLAVIASENINIDPSVAAVHGIYIADEAISTGASDTKLEAEGMFINGEDPGLDRDYEDDRNNTDPAMAFAFRPDLWLNSPTELWRSSYTWQELPP